VQRELKRVEAERENVAAKLRSLEKTYKESS
jgi:flagellar biosynthesis chaperone FliJ